MFLYFKNQLLKRLLSCFSNTAVMILLKKKKNKKNIRERFIVLRNTGTSDDRYFKAEVMTEKKKLSLSSGIFTRIGLYRFENTQQQQTKSWYAWIKGGS